MNCTLINVIFQAFSSATSYSPESISSIGSEQQGFVFPSLEEAEGSQSSLLIQPPVRRQRSMRSESFKTAILDDVYIESSNSNDPRHSSSIVSTAGTTVSDFDPEKFLNNALGDIKSLSESGICNVSFLYLRFDRFLLSLPYRECLKKIWAPNIQGPLLLLMMYPCWYQNCLRFIPP